MELPARLGKYELLEFLGGGMSHVFRAVDTLIERTVALKILTDVGCADSETRARFLQEARTAARIAHENILTIYEYGELNGRPFLAMEFLRGQDLQKAIRSGTTGDMASRIWTAVQVARAIEHIHANRITHRDIKPQNVHISSAGTAKLIDFGIAKSDGPAMTQAGFIIGTPCYMAPEQVLGKPVTNLVDVYAFGVLLFELFTGLKAVSGDSVQRVFYAVLHEPLNLAPLAEAGVPDGVRSIVSRCTAKEPAERIQSFLEIRALLESLSDHPVASSERPRSRRWPSIEATLAADRILVPVRRYRLKMRELWRTRPGQVGGLALAILLAVAGTLYFGLKRENPHAAGRIAPPAEVPPASVIQTSTGEMVLIPAGEFHSGEDGRSVSVPAFYVDRTEVTNEAYQRFCTETGHPLPRRFPKNQPDLPVVNVTIADARLFAAWAHKRLPTGIEWEKAARGGDGRKYPWGDTSAADRANVLPKGRSGTGRLARVTAFGEGASPYGILQMCGNAWEIVEEAAKPQDGDIEGFSKRLRYSYGRDKPWVAVRGGSFRYDLPVLFDRAVVPAPWNMEDDIGFRCVRDMRQRLDP